MSQPDTTVVGGSLPGRLLAWRATKAGLCVALYDAAGPTGEGAVASVASPLNIRHFAEDAVGIPRMTGLETRYKWPTACIYSCQTMH